jgi:hypothetical protein
MSLQAKQYGSEREPVQAADLQALTGCSLAWWYGREEEGTGAAPKAQDILEAAAREALLRALREGAWEADLCEKRFRDAYRRMAGKRPVDWEGKDPKQEGRAFVQMLKGFLPEARRRVAEIIAIDAPYSVVVGGVHCEGRVDLVYRNPEGKLCATKFTFDRRRRSQWLIDHEPELSLLGAASLLGNIDGVGCLGVWPERLELLTLRDLLPYRTGARVRIEHPDQMSHFHAPMWTSVVVPNDTTHGPAFYQSRQVASVLPRLEFSLKQWVAAVRGGRVVETFGEHCRFCPHQARCLGEGEGLLSRKEQEIVERALEGIPAQELALQL